VTDDATTQIELKLSPKQAQSVKALLDSGDWGLDEAEVVRNLIRIAVKELTGSPIQAADLKS